jgi:hypothetical protein
MKETVKRFKQIQVSADEWQKYKELSEQMSKELGIKVHINGFLKRVVFLYENNKVK